MCNSEHSPKQSTQSIQLHLQAPCTQQVEKLKAEAAFPDLETTGFSQKVCLKKNHAVIHFYFSDMLFDKSRPMLQPDYSYSDFFGYKMHIFYGSEETSKRDPWPDSRVFAGFFLSSPSEFHFPVDFGVMLCFLFFLTNG